MHQLCSHGAQHDGAPKKRRENRLQDRHARDGKCPQACDERVCAPRSAWDAMNSENSPRSFVPWVRVKSSCRDHKWGRTHFGHPRLRDPRGAVTATRTRARSVGVSRPLLPLRRRAVVALLSGACARRHAPCGAQGVCCMKQVSRSGNPASWQRKSGCWQS